MTLEGCNGQQEEEANPAAKQAPASSTPAQTVTITALGDLEDESWVDEIYGLLCQGKTGGRVIDVPLGECEARTGGPNRQLLKDYSYWFRNYG
jgi:hypothetical protein